MMSDDNDSFSSTLEDAIAMKSEFWAPIRSGSSNEKSTKTTTATNGKKKKKKTKAKEILDDDNTDDIILEEHQPDDDDNLLAVAVKVIEDVDALTDETFIKASIEYDPDSKPIQKSKTFLQKNRSLLILLIVVVIVVIVTIIGIYFGLYYQKHERERSDSNEFAIKQAILEWLGEEKLNDFAHQKAFHWITHTDKSLPSDERFYQRYGAAYLYYATTTVETPSWTYCSPPNALSRVSRCQFDSLIDLNYWKQTKTYQQMDGQRWLTSGIDECTWAGVFCNTKQQIETLRLSGIGMTGTFPLDVFAVLPNLQELHIGDGDLSGPLPNLSRSIRVLDLQMNQFTGTIPQSWYNDNNINITNMLDLSRNNINGTISSDIIKNCWLTLQFLGLSSNNFQGTIPTEIRLLQNLHTIELQENKFIGTIPTYFGQMSLLEVVRLDYNQLTGSSLLDVTFGPKIRDVVLAHNQLQSSSELNLTTMFPNTPDLTLLDVTNCGLTGTISPDIGNIKSLSYLYLADNDFTGILPETLQELPKLLRLDIAGNNFTGTVPVCDLELLRSDCNEIECECCTLCCQDNDTFGCSEVIP